MPDCLRLLPLLAALLLSACTVAPTTAPAPAASAPTPPATPTSVTEVPVLDAQDDQAEIARHLQKLAGPGREHLAVAELGYYMDVLQARFQQIDKRRFNVARQPAGILITLTGTTSFEFGSASLTAEAESILASIAKVLVDYRSTVVAIHGHTDAMGDAPANQRLSVQRAIAVAHRLIIAGVAKERLVAAGHGASRPIAPNDTPEGRDANRRVELQIVPISE